MHIQFRFNDLIVNSIINHFNQLIPTPSTTSNSTLDETKPSQSSSRSREAIQCRNQQRHETRKLKRRQH
ncbi:unnamed protein product, partial [Rotaria sp. Silwood2]